MFSCPPTSSNPNHFHLCDLPPKRRRRAPSHPDEDPPRVSPSEPDEPSDLDSFDPGIFMVTDGEPTDSNELLEKATQRIRQADGQGRGKKVAFFAVGVEGANMQRLTRISKRSPQKLRGFDFGRLFRWVAESLRRVSRSLIGDRVELPKKDDWAEA